MSEDQATKSLSLVKKFKKAMDTSYTSIKSLYGNSNNNGKPEYADKTKKNAPRVRDATIALVRAVYPEENLIKSDANKGYYNSRMALHLLSLFANYNTGDSNNLRGGEINGFCEYKPVANQREIAFAKYLGLGTMDQENAKSAIFTALHYAASENYEPNYNGNDEDKNKVIIKKIEYLLEENDKLSDDNINNCKTAGNIFKYLYGDNTHAANGAVDGVAAGADAGAGGLYKFNNNIAVKRRSIARALLLSAKKSTVSDKKLNDADSLEYKNDATHLLDPIIVGENDITGVARDMDSANFSSSDTYKNAYNITKHINSMYEDGIVNLGGPTAALQVAQAARTHAAAKRDEANAVAGFDADGVVTEAFAAAANAGANAAELYTLAATAAATAAARAVANANNAALANAAADAARAAATAFNQVTQANNSTRAYAVLHEIYKKFCTYFEGKLNNYGLHDQDNNIYILYKEKKDTCDNAIISNAADSAAKISAIRTFVSGLYTNTNVKSLWKYLKFAQNYAILKTTQQHRYPYNSEHETIIACEAVLLNLDEIISLGNEDSPIYNTFLKQRTVLKISDGTELSHLLKKENIENAIALLRTCLLARRHYIKDDNAHNTLGLTQIQLAVNQVNKYTITYADFKANGEEGGNRAQVVVLPHNFKNIGSEGIVIAIDINTVDNYHINDLFTQFVVTYNDYNKAFNKYKSSHPNLSWEDGNIVSELNEHFETNEPYIHEEDFKNIQENERYREVDGYLEFLNKDNEWVPYNSLTRIEQELAFKKLVGENDQEKCQNGNCIDFINKCLSGKDIDKCIDFFKNIRWRDLKKEIQSLSLNTIGKTLALLKVKKIQGHPRYEQIGSWVDRCKEQNITINENFKNVVRLFIEYYNNNNKNYTKYGPIYDDDQTAKYNRSVNARNNIAQATRLKSLVLNTNTNRLEHVRTVRLLFVQPPRLDPTLVATARRQFQIGGANLVDIKPVYVSKLYGPFLNQIIEEIDIEPSFKKELKDLITELEKKEIKFYKMIDILQKYYLYIQSKKITEGERVDQYKIQDSIDKAEQTGGKINSMVNYLINFIDNLQNNF